MDASEVNQRSYYLPERALRKITVAAKKYLSVWHKK